MRKHTVDSDSTSQTHLIDCSRLNNRVRGETNVFGINYCVWDCGLTSFKDCELIYWT